ncbi:Poly [ADP-ribose] polymerase 1 [Folsomia candida]|uniref:Poly [ADP-ribose] polymerase 1 n=1 Tax=Folsomia candida TaxID=158441 RepID=A0A226D2M9_FOLCA|nr:Poly [ADP-ribose] polymerase 1 [Folsomia candida]
MHDASILHTRIEYRVIFSNPFLRKMGFLTEYAKSGRSVCRGCHGPITKGTLRLANLVQASRHSGMDAHWFHVSCFFKKHKNVTQAEIGKFDELKSEDQQLLAKCFGGQIPETVTAGPVEREVIENSGEFSVEYAKSNKSHCISCEGRIVKDEVRISQKDYTSQRAKRLPMGCLDRWHHVDCFTANRLNLRFYNNANSISGISWLKKEDLEMLVSKLPSLQEPENLPEQENINALCLPKMDKLPLLNLKFLISDTLTLAQIGEVRTKIEQFGGKVVTRLGVGLSAIFATQAEVESMTSKRITFAQENKIPILSPAFVSDLTTVGFEFDIVAKKYLLSYWICTYPSSCSSRHAQVAFSGRAQN